jgi:hypothetical protein
LADTRGNTWVWYYADEGDWWVGAASSIGTETGTMYARASAATPDAVAAGRWRTTSGFQPIASVKCTRS